MLMTGFTLLTMSIFICGAWIDALSCGQDAINAVRAALPTQEMVAALNARRVERGEPGVRLGVGVATGQVVAGTIGSPKRMDYTVIGDSVNLVVRLQDLTKTYGEDVVIDVLP